MGGRKSTGIELLDEMMDGGFKEGTLNMVDGEAGTGKSILATHFICDGLEKGENVIYMNLEEDTEAFFKNMGEFGFDLATHQRAGKLIFMDADATALKDVIKKGSLGIEDQIMQLKPSRFVLDSISEFALLYDNLKDQHTAVHQLMEKLKMWKLTTLLVSESSQDYTKFGLEYMVDGIVKMCYRKVGHERVRTIEIIKMRGTKHKTTETVYRIEKKGVVLYPGEIIFQ